MHAHPHEHAHSHHPARPQSHGPDSAHGRRPSHSHGASRRAFLKSAALTALFGPSLLEQSMMAAAQARAAEAANPSGEKLFDLNEIARGVYVARARPQLLVNSNACVIVSDDDVMVVDTHSKPSAARALIAQIREVTPKPVRYVVNTHFHFDHAQGNHAYPAAFPGGVRILASQATRDLLLELGQKRLQASVENVPQQIERLRRALENAGDEPTRAQLRALIAQGEAYRKEMRDVPIDLPEVTFSDRMAVHAKGREIHLLLLGRAHTAGDVVVYLPKEKVVATGDMAHGFLPYMGDSFPTEWPATLGKLRALDFSRVAPGHGPAQEGKKLVASFARYIEEITGAVKAGIEKGKTVEELQREITPAALKSLAADGYEQMLRENYAKGSPAVPGLPPAFETSLRGNIADVYAKLKA